MFLYMIRTPPRATPTCPPFPHTTLFRTREPERADRNQQVDERRTHHELDPQQERSQHCDEPEDHGRKPGCDAADREAESGEEVERPTVGGRSEEPTSEAQSLIRIAYAVFCLEKHIYRTIYLPHAYC